MKSSKLFICVALVLAGILAAPDWLPAQAVPAQSAAAPAVAPTAGVGPKIQFNTEIYDFGQIVPFEPLNYTFTVTNAGDEPLIITNAKPGCSCTVPGATFPQTLAPHETTKIPVQINTTGLKGGYMKPVTVTSNDRDKSRQTVVLQMRLMAWLPIDVSPQPRAWFTIMPDAESTAPVTLHIVNNTTNALTLSSPVSSTADFSAELKPKVPGKEFDLVITPGPASKFLINPKMTVTQAEITMKTSVSNMPELSIPVLASILSRVVIQPDRITLQPGPLARGVTNWINIHANTTNGISVFDPKVNADGVSVQVKMLQANRSYVIPVVFPAGFDLKQDQHVSISVKTDMPGYSTITIPVDPMLGLPAVKTANPVQQTPGGRVTTPVPALPVQHQTP